MVYAAWMVVEIAIALYSHSMALLADGIHMGTHVVVIGLTWGAYVVVRRLAEKGNERYCRDRILNLTAYTSGVLLLILAIGIMVEAVERLFSPEITIRYSEAITVAAASVVINCICAYALHTHDRKDYNTRSAYLHVLSDTLTGIGAVIGLLCSRLWSITWLDSLIGIISSIIVSIWAWRILKATARLLASKTT